MKSIEESILNNNSGTLKKEESKNQLKNKPEITKIAQSKDNLSDLLSNDMDDEDGEDFEDEEDDEYDDEDEERDYGEDDILNPAHNSDEELMGMQRSPKEMRKDMFSPKQRSPIKKISTKGHDDWGNI